ncbi:MAG: hypothetical protein P4M09_18085 [Devosia sp.]|nr:hypothetical protein [Devosia sp.]
MEFLDATVEEAEAWIATKQVVRKRAASAAETDEVRTLLRRIGPSMKPGQTFREAMNIARKK